MAETKVKPEAAADPFAPTQRLMTSTTLEGAPVAAEPLYPPEGPDPKGTTPAGVLTGDQGPSSAAQGAGIEGEEVVWEGSYSMRNFVGRLAWRVVLSIAWLVLAVETWANGHENLAPVTIITGIILLFFWLAIAYRIMQARFGHHYLLTNRRLFVSTGVMRRRRDQMELLRVKDVFVRQTLMDRWFSIGTVVVVCHEKELPTFYLAGVDDPQQVMDLVWHHARAERDNRSTKIDSV